MNTPDEVRCPHIVRRGDSIIATCPRHHRGIEQRLEPPRSAPLRLAADPRQPLVRYAYDGNAETPGQPHHDSEYRRIGVHVLVRVEMRQLDTCAPQPLDLRGQLELHFDYRHLATQAGDDERFPRAPEPSIA